MCKIFKITLSGKGTHTQLLQALLDLQSGIKNTPKPHTKIEANYIRSQIRIIKANEGKAGIMDYVSDLGLPSEYCAKCNEVTPTLRAFKYCVCVYCNRDRLQDITLQYQDPFIKASITEIDK